MIVMIWGYKWNDISGMVVITFDDISGMEMMIWEYKWYDINGKI